jgi:type IV pilus assembly protein PilV
MSVMSIPGGHAKQGGVALLEALVAILIFSFGVLSLVGLQASMTRAQSSSKFRADATYLAAELVGIMWSDIPNVNQYTTAGCAAYSRCKDWSAKVSAALPGGGVVLGSNNGLVTITITWATPGEGTHTYTTSTAIRT